MIYPPPPKKKKYIYIYIYIYIYQLLSNNIKNKKTNIFSTLNKVARENKKVILTGHFNLDLLQFDTNTEVHDFLDLLTWKQFTSHKDIHCYSENLIEKITDHLPNFLIIEKLTVKLDNQDRPLKRAQKNFDEDKLIRDIEELNLK